jgi:hypothetical protein
MDEVVRLQRKYVQAQMRSLAEQACEMGRIVSRTAVDPENPKNIFLQ